MIGGFIVREGRGTLVLRALGPSLTQAGIADALQDPVITVYDANGYRYSGNDDWQTGANDSYNHSGSVPRRVGAR